MSVIYINDERKLVGQDLINAFSIYESLNLMLNAYAIYTTEVRRGLMVGHQVSVLSIAPQTGLLIAQSISRQEYYLLHEDNVGEF